MEQVSRIKSHTSRMIILHFDDEFWFKNPSSSSLFKMDLNGGFGIFSKCFGFMILNNEDFHVIPLYIFKWNTQKTLNKPLDFAAACAGLQWCSTPALDGPSQPRQGVTTLHLWLQLLDNLPSLDHGEVPIDDTLWRCITATIGRWLLRHLGSSRDCHANSFDL